MSARTLDQLGELQRAVLEAVWQLGEATVQQVRDQLTQRDLAYTTVLTVMQKLSKQGWLTYRRQDRAHVYRAVRTRDEEGVSRVRRVIDQLFDGDRLRLFQHLIEDEALTPQEVASLKELIAAKRKEKRHDR
jgi:predicted transcriptional regulator